MKDNETDRLFRQKLEGFQQEPSPQAWQQLQDQLQQKKGRKWFFYLPGVAASLLLLLGLWAVFEYSAAYLPADTLSGDPKSKIEKEIHQTEPAISRNTPEPKELTTSAPVRAVEEQGTLAKTENAEPAAKDKEVKNKNKDKAETKAKQEPIKKTQEESLAAFDSKSKRLENLKKETSSFKEAEGKSLISSFSEPVTIVAPLQISPEPSEEVIIHYRADNAEKEISDQTTNTLAEAQDNEEKEFSAKKVLGFLSKVKTNSNANLAELREAKDELLSFRIGKSNEKN